MVEAVHTIIGYRALSSSTVVVPTAVDRKCFYVLEFESDKIPLLAFTKFFKFKELKCWLSEDLTKWEQS